MSETDLEVVKWYTRARKFPQLIGRTPDGARIWGGPYTITQAVGGGLLLLFGVNTMRWWARYGLVGNALLLLGCTYALMLLLGRIPVGSRNPLSVGTGVLRALSSPPTGSLAGHPVKIGKPVQVRHRIGVQTRAPNRPPPAGPPGQPGPAAPPAPAALAAPPPPEPAGTPTTRSPSRRRPAAQPPAAAAAVGRAPLTAVQQLLAGSPPATSTATVTATRRPPPVSEP